MKFSSSYLLALKVWLLVFLVVPLVANLSSLIVTLLSNQFTNTTNPYLKFFVTFVVYSTPRTLSNIPFSYAIWALFTILLVLLPFWVSLGLGKRHKIILLTLAVFASTIFIYVTYLFSFTWICLSEDCELMGLAFIGLGIYFIALLPLVLSLWLGFYLSVLKSRG